jgi:serine/threonine-protein kinase HipA
MNDFTESLHVDYCSTQPIAMGRLTYINRRIAFEYTPEFLELGFELSPFKLPLKPGVQFSADTVFEGLFGVFNDSLPDGWGRLLLDRKLRNQGLFPNNLTPLDRLRYVGTHGMGALQYRPAFPFASMKQKEIELDQLAQECVQFEAKEEEQFLDELIRLNGSSAGARPKILVSLDPKTKLIRASDNHRNHTHPDWIIKFRSSLDPRDMGSIEYAYHLMASAAGVIVPEARLFKSKLCSGYFGVKRFDRNEKIFLHSHTLSGLLHADHRMPSLDYEAVMKATAILTKNIVEQKKQFRQIAFNVFAHNRDDHAKNFSFLMDENGIWSVSPAYDLTFSAGPGGEHCTTLMGNGRSPGKSDLLKLAAVSSIDHREALDILEPVKEAVSQWKQFAQEAGVSKSSTQLIQKKFNEMKSGS